MFTAGGIFNGGNEEFDMATQKQRQLKTNLQKDGRRRQVRELALGIYLSNLVGGD
jgi:hypothetical protein